MISGSQSISGAIPSTSSTTTSATPSNTPAAVNGYATITWAPPMQNTDGSMLTDLAGYHIYYGNSTAALNFLANLPSASQVWYTVQNLGAGTWYFTIRAYNSAGVESAYSSAASKTII